MRPPFPGMDPWLEHPEIWHGVHIGLIVSIADDLASKLEPRYFVDIQERVYLVEPEPRHYLGRPDVAISGLTGRTDSSSGGGRGSTSTLEYVETEIEIIDSEEEVTLRRLEIRDAASRELVTVIELLSPTNKLDRHGREQYLEKRKAYVDSNINFIEIDLLRAGEPIITGYPAGADYRILIARAESLPRAKLREFNLRQPIPPIPIPLRPSEAEPTLELNAVLHGVYERARYDLRIDYSRPPVPPLSESDARWAAEVVASPPRESRP